MAFLVRGLLVAAILGAATLSADAAGNLVKDASFEKPTVEDGGFLLLSAGAAFNGWSVVGSGNIAIFSGDYAQDGFSFPAKKGAQWLDLTGNMNQPSGVQRTIRTEPGTTYDLALYVGNIVDTMGGLGTKSTVDVLVDGAPLASFVNKSGQGDNALSWRKYTAQFTAQHGKTLIAFMNGDPPTDASNGIDGVSVTPATAP
jgi:HpiC1 cyclase